MTQILYAHMNKIKIKKKKEKVVSSHVKKIEIENIRYIKV
jgi:hypothetical protein